MNMKLEITDSMLDFVRVGMPLARRTACRRWADRGCRDDLEGILDVAFAALSDCVARELCGAESEEGSGRTTGAASFEDRLERHIELALSRRIAGKCTPGSSGESGRAASWVARLSELARRQSHDE